MANTALHRTFAPLKRVLPGFIHGPIRRIGTAFIGPIWFAHRTGYFKSALKAKAVQKDGSPNPWYTYSAIDFLKLRDYGGRKVMEFGGGQSSLWWAQRADKVVTFEGNQDWYNQIRSQMPGNVNLHHIAASDEEPEAQAAQVREILQAEGEEKYDVIVIDGLHRSSKVPIAVEYLSDDGVLVLDNAEGFGFHEALLGYDDLQRVDFFGNAPGVVLPHSTSVCFRSNAFVFDRRYPIGRPKNAE